MTTSSIFKIRNQFGINTALIFKMWKPFGLVSGINRYGMVNTDPLRNFIKKFFDEYGYDMKRKIMMAGVNVSDMSMLLMETMKFLMRHYRMRILSTVL